MNNIMQMNLFYIKYSLLPNLVAFGLAYSYYNNIKLNCSLSYYYNYILNLFNICRIDLKDEYRIINNILIYKYSLIIVDVNYIELVALKK